MRLTALAVLYPLALVVACSGSDEPGTSATPGTDGGQNMEASADSAASTQCLALFDRAKTCKEHEEALRAEYLAWCKAFEACLVSMMDPAYVAEYWPCDTARSCGQDDDSCGENAATANMAKPDRKQAYDACEARHDACCSGQECGFPADICVLAAVGNDTTLAELNACVAKDCAQAGPCLYQIISSHGCDLDEPSEAPVIVDH